MIIELTQKKLIALLEGKGVEFQYEREEVTMNEKPRVGRIYMKRETCLVERWHAWVPAYVRGNRKKTVGKPDLHHPRWWLAGEVPRNEFGRVWKRCPELDRTVVL